MSTETSVGQFPKNSKQTLWTEYKSTDVEGVGTVMQDQKGNVYRWMKNAESADAWVQYGLVGSKVSDQANMNSYGYKGTLTADLSVLAGVAMAATPAGSYGWVLVRGYAASVYVTQATSGGADVAAGAYLKGVNSAVYAIVDATTQPLYKRGLQVLEAVTTSTATNNATTAAKKCFVSCL